MFQYVVETERRFYLANEVNSDVTHEDGRTYFELELQRRVGLGHVPPDEARFVSDVQIVTFKDVNIEELPRDASASEGPEVRT